MSKSSLSRPIMLSIHKVHITIYHDLLRFYEKIYIFCHNSGSNQDIFILIEDLRSLLEIYKPIRK